MNRGLFLAVAFVAVLAVSALALACGDDDEGEVDVIGGTGTSAATGTSTATGAAEASVTGSPAPVTVDPDAEVIDAVLDEWSVKPAKTSATGGPLTFSARNAGEIAHELVIIKTNTAIDKLPVANGKVDEDKAGETLGEIEAFAPGLTEAATFDLSAGKYALICNLAGHYEQGMYAPFTVN